MSKNQILLEATRDLIDGDSMSPQDWIGFLFELQTDMIYHGLLEGYEKPSRQSVAVRFLKLNNLFTTLREEAGNI